MHPDRWQQISQVYHAALTRDARDRAGFLREACAGDDTLQQEVASLLSNESQAAGFLSDPAFAAAAGIVTHADGTMLTGRRIGVYQYDVARDGQRFLLNVPLEDAAPSSITVVLNWAAGLKK